MNHHHCAESSSGSATAPPSAGEVSIATPPARRTKRRSASLAPREHGAYAQLGFPLATGLAVGGLTLASLLWTVVVVLAFLAHEPALVLLGQRGKRALRELGPRARRRLLALGAVATPALVTAVVLATPLGARAMLASMLLTAPLGAFIWRGTEKSGAGELVAATAFASASAPLVLEGGAPVATAATLVASWSALFIMGTLAVRGVIHHLRAPRGAMRPAALAVALVWSGTLTLLINEWISPLTALALGPTTLLAVALIARTPHPRHLRTLGFTLLGTSTFAALLMIVGHRLSMP